MEWIRIYHNISPYRYITWSYEFLWVPSIFVFVSFKELSFNDSRVFLCRLKYWNRVVSEIIRNYESSVYIFRNLCIESSGESKYFSIIVHIFEKVSSWLFWFKSINISQRILFITKPIIRRNDYTCCIRDSGLFVRSNFKVLSIFPYHIILCKWIDPNYMEFSWEGINWFSGIKIKFCPVRLSVIFLSWLKYHRFLWNFLSF